MIRATVIADASWCPKTRAGAFACWINVNWPNGDHRRIKESGRFKTRPTSSEWAEAMAAWAGIWYAYQAGARDLLVQSDCLNIVRTGGAPRSTKGFGEYRKNSELYWPDATLRWKHVKGHTGGQCPNGGDDRRFYVNEWCDVEAKKHMRSWRAELQ